MSRALLLVWQLAIAVLLIAFWQLASTTHVLGNPDTISFFFSTPAAVAAQI